MAHIDALVGEIDVQATGPGPQPGQRDAGVAHPRDGADGSGTRGEQQSTVAGLAHPRQDGGGRREGTADEHVEHRTHGLRRGLCGGREPQRLQVGHLPGHVGEGGGRAVGEDADPPQFFGGHLQSAGQGLRIGDVGGVGAGDGPFSGQVVGKAAQLLGIAGNQGDGVPGAAEAAGDRTAQAGTGTNDGDHGLCGLHGRRHAALPRCLR